MYLEHMKRVTEEEICCGHQEIINLHKSTSCFGCMGTFRPKNYFEWPFLVRTTIQEDLFNTVRKYKFAFTAGIEKMYGQILVDKMEPDYQRIV